MEESLPWSRAFEALMEQEDAQRALALGLPARGRGLTLHLDPPELRGAATWALDTWASPVVIPLRVQRQDHGDADLLLARVGAWPALLDGDLVIRGERLTPPADPEALVRGLGAFLVPGALAELLRLNLERHSRVGVPQPDVLLAGVERLYDGVTEVLTARLLVGR
ncbi:hypothetical protein L6R49_04545 [Myxococcota bacterium]|nr:hypothetical protein [Myxococcota bacterium]